MFTGLIREMATVLNYSNNTLILQAKYKPKIGDSIAINGVCLTVIEVKSGSFSVELSPETEKTVVLENFQNNKTVHIEPAMQLNDRFEGHIVQGHVDTIGVISQINKNSNSYDYFLKIDDHHIKYMIPKGSIAIDGVSLTINEVLENNIIRLTIIPHTAKNSLFKYYKINTQVNIETDMFARYIENLLLNREKNKNNLSWEKVDNILARY
jgi:riboflavin synthase